jgi:glycogen operon protein
MVWLNGDGVGPPGPQGEHVVDDDFLLLFNANVHPMRFSIPKSLRTSRWRRVVDTAAPGATGNDVDVRRTVAVPGFTVVVLQRHD